MKPKQMQLSFLLRYLDAFHRIEGWFSYDAALMFMVYNQLLARSGVSGDVLEIGVHHGLSAIAIASLRCPGSRLFAVDLFEGLQDQNVSRSGGGDRSLFEQNMKSFYPDASFIKTLACPSARLATSELGTSFSFCHIDGGHSPEETYGDLMLCHEVLLPGGLVALDDYFNVEHPGVCEGAVQFMLEHANALRPLAIGFNKVLFQKHPAPSDLNAEFRDSFPTVEHKIVKLWGQPTTLFTSVFRSYFDLQASTPGKFYLLGSAQPRAILKPQETLIRVGRDVRTTLEVTVTNNSVETFPSGEGVFGLSYHLLTRNGEILRHDNDREYFTTALAPGDTRRTELAVQAPREGGEYKLELDLVWEGVMWFRDIANPTAIVEMVVF